MVSRENGPLKFIDPFHLGNDGEYDEKDILEHLLCFIADGDLLGTRRCNQLDRKRLPRKLGTFKAIWLGNYK
jgi:hypothetical protein